MYELLEISPNASQAVIQAAYRALVRSYHPDLNTTAEAAHRIRQLNAAYTLLSDPQDRARYDLECLRAHRFERVIHPDHGGSIPRPPMADRRRSLPVRPPVSQQPAMGERLPMLNGAAIFGLLMVVALAAILLVLFSVAIDAPADYNSVFDGPNIELGRR